MTIDMNALEQGLEILGLGWGGIFVVMIIIYLVSMGLCKMFPPSKDAYRTDGGRRGASGGGGTAGAPRMVGTHKAGRSRV